MPVAIITLFLAAFCIGTTEFVVAGLLPEVAGDLSISIPTAGYLISAYAIGVAIGGPVITLATARIPRKRNLLLLMSIFVGGHIWCAVAPGFEMLMAGRLMVSLSHGSFYGVASVVAVTIVPEGRRGAAVAWLFAGITVANVVGVPAGTAIGNWLGWQATFWVIGGAGVLVTIAMMMTIPGDTDPTGPRPGLNAQISALANQKVLLAYLNFAVMLIGFWAFFTFIAPHLAQVAAVTKHQLPIMLFLFGVGATVGTVIGGRLADLSPNRTLAAIFPLQVFVFTVVAISGENQFVLGAVLFVFGTVMFVPASAVVNRILTGAARAPDLASTLVSTAANTGIAIGALVGAQALSAGLSYAQLPWIGVVFTALAGAVMLLSLKLDKREVV